MRSTCPAWARLLLCVATWCGGVWPVPVGVGADAAPSAVTASEFTPAITAADLDIERCGAFTGGDAAGPAPRETLEALLGLRTNAAAAWKTAAGPDTVRHFRVAFKQPVAIGTICTTHAGMDSVFWFGAPLERTVSLLKSDASYPGDITNEAHWMALPDGRVKTLPPGTSTRAVRFTERYPSPVATPSSEYTTPGSAMGVALFFKERYYQATNLGAEKEEWLGKVAANLTPLATNCLFTGNNGYGIDLANISTPTGKVAFSLFYGNTNGAWFGVVTDNGNNTTSQAPLYVNEANNNYRIMALSPAFNTGTNLLAAGVTMDIMGVSRPKAGFFDRGAYELALPGGTVFVVH